MYTIGKEVISSTPTPTYSRFFKIYPNLNKLNAVINERILMGGDSQLFPLGTLFLFLDRSEMPRFWNGRDAVPIGTSQPSNYSTLEELMTYVNEQRGWRPPANGQLFYVEDIKRLFYYKDGAVAQFVEMEDVNEVKKLQYDFKKVMNEELAKVKSGVIERMRDVKTGAVISSYGASLLGGATMGAFGGFLLGQLTSPATERYVQTAPIVLSNKTLAAASTLLDRAYIRYKNGKEILTAKLPLKNSELATIENTSTLATKDEVTTVVSNALSTAVERIEQSTEEINREIESLSSSLTLALSTKASKDEVTTALATKASTDELNAAISQLQYDAQQLMILLQILNNVKDTQVRKVIDDIRHLELLVHSFNNIKNDEIENLGDRIYRECRLLRVQIDNKTNEISQLRTKLNEVETTVNDNKDDILDYINKTEDGILNALNIAKGAAEAYQAVLSLYEAYEKFQNRKFDKWFKRIVEIVKATALVGGAVGIYYWASDRDEELQDRLEILEVEYNRLALEHKRLVEYLSTWVGACDGCNMNDVLDYLSGVTETDLERRYSIRMRILAAECENLIDYLMSLFNVGNINMDDLRDYIDETASLTETNLEKIERKHTRLIDYLEYWSNAGNFSMTGIKSACEVESLSSAKFKRYGQSKARVERLEEEWEKILTYLENWINFNGLSTTNIREEIKAHIIEVDDDGEEEQMEEEEEEEFDADAELQKAIDEILAKFQEEIDAEKEEEDELNGQLKKLLGEEDDEGEGEEETEEIEEIINE